jgi:archaellum component FlaC
MTRVERNKTVYLLCGLALLAAIAAGSWRELSNRQALAGALERESALQDSIQEMSSRLEQSLAGLASANETSNAQKIEIRDLTDRIANLSAQRDHLRSDNEQKVRQMQSLESQVKSIRDELAESKLSILELESLPRRLAADLDMAKERIAQLESALDHQAAAAMDLPETYVLEGVSSDNRVFSLAGGLADNASLPRTIYLCGPEGIILEGWIYKSTGERILGHVRNWHQAASALVKGEKVFILPVKDS